jgi:hypothetical protein
VVFFASRIEKAAEIETERLLDGRSLMFVGEFKHKGRNDAAAREGAGLKAAALHERRIASRDVVNFAGVNLGGRFVGSAASCLWDDCGKKQSHNERGENRDDD